MWLSVSKVAELLRISDRAVRKKIASGEFRIKEMQNTRAHAGKTYLIHLTSLPSEAQKKFINDSCTDKDSLVGDSNQSSDSDNDAVFYEYIRKYGAEELDRVLEVEAAIKDIESTRTRKELGEKSKQWAQHFGVTDRVVRLWRKEYKSKGIVGLFRKQRQDKGNVRSTCQPVADRLKYVYLQPNRLTIREVYKQVSAEVRETNEDTCNECFYGENCEEPVKSGWIIGSYETAARILDSLEYGEKKRYREGLQACRKDAMPKGRVDFTKYLVNERWVSDHHVCDFYCVDEHGYLARPQLTIWQDFRARVVTGLTLSFQGNGKTIGLAFYHGILPKPDSPIKGIPKETLMDNGKDYRSHYLGQPERITGRHEWTPEMRGLFAVLKVDPHFCKPYSPWGKINESFFRTFKIQFSVHVPGYTGGSPDTRPENHEKELKKLHKEGKIPTLPEAFERIKNWIFNDYHNAVHDELGDTPLNVYQNTPRYEGGTVSKEVANVLLYDTETRKVGRDGIRFKKALYKDRALYELQEEKVVVRFDPLNLGEIIVEHEGKLVCVAQRYTPMATQEDIANNAKEQHYYMNRIKEKNEGYKTGSSSGRRVKSREVITGEVRDNLNSRDFIPMPVAPLRAAGRARAAFSSSHRDGSACRAARNAR
ncbi:MAG: Mu transposase C-terminal domain-containing protein [Bacillota bacterium]|nr:Mu transposase C-terminal domain-containing protein [Bacillota bacterium]